MVDSNERSLRDEDDEPSQHASSKRGSKSRSSRSSHRHSSGSSSSRHRRESSSHSSPRTRSPRTPGSAKSSKDKLRIAKLDGSKIRSLLPVSSSPGAHNVSNSPRNASSKRTSNIHKLRSSKLDGSKIRSPPSVPSSLGAHNVSSSPRNASGKRTSKDKLRNAKLDGSTKKIRSSQQVVSSSPGAHNVSSSPRDTTRKNPKYSRPSGQSEPGASHASESDRRAERKASRNERGQQESLSLAARNVSSSSKFSGGRRTGDLTKVLDHGTDEVQPPTLLQQDSSPPTLETTADVQSSDAQLEAKRQHQASRNERRNKPVPENNNRGSPKYKYMLVVGLVIFIAIAGGIAAWQLLSRAPTSVNLAPTAEDCLAISEGSEVEGQDEMAPKTTVQVELNLAMADSDANPEQLEAELEAKLQREVLPLLVGCGNEGPVSIENINSIIENAVLQSVSITNSTNCTSNTEETCSSVNLAMGLFLRDDKDLDQSVLDLVTDLFQHERLLELLNLVSAVEEVAFIRVVEVFPSLPSLPPSSSPSSKGVPVVEDDIQVPEDDIDNLCESIANGTPIIGQETLSVQRYEALLDVAFNSQVELPLRSIELQRQLQAVIVPALAGCNVVRRRQSSSLSIETGLIIEAENVINGLCLPGSEALCYRYIIYVDIFVRGALSSTDFAPVIRGEFQKPSLSTLVSRLGLTSPFERIAFVGVLARTVSESPSAYPTTKKVVSFKPSLSASASFEPTILKSQGPTALPSLTPSVGPAVIPAVGPTLMPGVGPTLEPSSFPSSQRTLLPTALPTSLSTLAPTISPSALPSLQPSALPTTQHSAFPSLQPSAFPTPQHSALPSLQPSVYPSVRPTASPSLQPSLFPSLQPSESPSASPSMPCIQTNTQLKDAVDDWTSGDSGLKSSVEAQYGPIGVWCFSSTGITSMAELFKDKRTFNEDISAWDVSSVTNMDAIFRRAVVFNQDLSSWDVSSVTTMVHMFWGASAFNQDISSWDVSSVTTMERMFYYSNVFNQDISSWDVSSVTNMKGIFSYARTFNQNLSSWDVSSVTNMIKMFYGRTVFNQDISSWDVSSVTTMSYMFWDARAFNQDISSWDVSSVTSLEAMFWGASVFNQDISSWDVSSVTHMKYMFYDASAFNQDISSWDVSSVVTMDEMFWDASAFNQDLCAWGGTPSQ